MVNAIIYKFEEGGERGHWRSKAPSRLGGDAPMLSILIISELSMSKLKVSGEGNSDDISCSAGLNISLQFPWNILRMSIVVSGRM